MTGLLIRDCEVAGRPGVDVRIRDGHVVEIRTGLAGDGDDELPAYGGALLPGLHDHHLHLHATAAASSSVPCGPPSVRSLEQLATALRAAAAHGAVRGVGYHETVAGLLDRDVLDRLVADQPVRVQHRSGAAWFLNSAAIDLLRLAEASDPAVERSEDGRPTGRLWRGDHLLRVAGEFPDLEPLGRELARLGVTGVTDATPALTEAAVAALRDARLPQRLLLLGAPLADGGDDVGPWKVVLDEATDLDLAALVDVIRRCRDSGRAVAIHAVTRAEAVVAVAALRDAGAAPGSRLEHGSVLPRELDRELAALGVSVVTQPHFVAERGDDYLRDVDGADVPDLYRCASLAAAGVPLAAGSDAPHGDLDPWRLIASAVARRTATGNVLGPAERLSPTQALDLLLGPLRHPGGPPRRVAEGEPADLCLLDAPLEAVLRDPSAELVRATVIDGRLVHLRP